MSLTRNKALSFVAKVNRARRFAEEFGIIVPGIDVDVENLDPRYVAAYSKALTGDLILITERVKELWVDSVEGKNEIDTRELAKLNKTIKAALVFGNSLLKE